MKTKQSKTKPKKAEKITKIGKKKAWNGSFILIIKR